MQNIKCKIDCATASGASKGQIACRVSPASGGDTRIKALRPGHSRRLRPWGGFLRPNLEGVTDMKRFLTLALMVFAMACALSGCVGEGRELSRMGKAVGLDLSGGTLLQFEDSHGGFHGDGETFAVVEADGLAEGLAGLPGWKPLPMTEQVGAAVGGVCGPEGLTMMGRIPEIGEGFYYFHDRHQESADPYDDTGLHGRFSYNFTVAAYDSAEGRLYYYELDT